MDFDRRVYLSPDQITQLSISVPANQWQYNDEVGAYIHTITLPEEYLSRAISSVDIDMSNATSDNASQLLDTWFLINRATISENIVQLICFYNAPAIDINIMLEVF